jgi:hypothetical protein
MSLGSDTRETQNHFTPSGNPERRGTGTERANQREKRISQYADDRHGVAARLGARLLDLQGSDSHWGGAAFVPHAWISTMDTLQLLRDLGVDPANDRVRRAIGQVRERCTWGEEFGDSPFFEGEVEPWGACDPYVFRRGK